MSRPRLPFALLIVPTLCLAGCRKDSSPEPSTPATPAQRATPSIAGRHTGLETKAQQKLSEVHAAAARRDLPALRSLMHPEFTWSFGGDAIADQAIDAWRQDPSRVEALQRALEQGSCELEGRYITCEHAASATGRLVFREQDGSWIWESFVEGD